MLDWDGVGWAAKQPDRSTDATWGGVREFADALFMKRRPTVESGTLVEKAGAGRDSRKTAGC